MHTNNQPALGASLEASGNVAVGKLCLVFFRRETRLVWGVARASVEATAAQVIGNYDVSDGVEDELDVIGICRTNLVAINFFVR